MSAQRDASPIETVGFITLSRIGFPYFTSPITRYGLLSAGLIYYPEDKLNITHVADL